MKTELQLALTTVALLVGVTQAAAQGTAFTYQGRLASGGTAANGSFDIKSALFPSASGGSQVGVATTNSAVGVSNGLFNVVLDFGPNFPGADRWLELGVRTNGGGSFTTLAPRQKLTAVPYAITASNVTGVIPNNSFAGAYSSQITLNNTANSFSGNGSGLTGLNAAQITSGTLNDARLSANIPRLNNTQTFTAPNNFLGPVGIGTTPSATLHVSGNGGDELPQTWINQQNPGAYARLRFTSGGDNNKRWDVATATNVFIIYSAIYGDMLQIDANGLRALHGLVIETRTNNPASPATGQIWLRTDL